MGHSNISNQSGDWMSLAEVKAQQQSQLISPRRNHHRHGSPSHSTVSCPYTSSSVVKHNAMRNPRNGYGSEIEGSPRSSPGVGGGSGGGSGSGKGEDFNNESGEGTTSDCSDSDFDNRVPGSKGKSAGSVMMKLAKKFSKKNLPIMRDEGEAAAEENGKWKMKQRSNSVSNLTSVDG